MTEYEILAELLPIVYPFKISKIDKDIEKKEVHFYLEIEKTYPKPKAYIKHQYYDRIWEHLPLFEYRCFLHCKIPIYKNRETGLTKALKIDFSPENSRFTLLFEQISLIVDLDTSKIINIQDGKGSDVLENLHHLHPNPEEIKNISVDMSPAFKLA